MSSLLWNEASQTWEKITMMSPVLHPSVRREADGRGLGSSCQICLGTTYLKTWW